MMKNYFRSEEYRHLVIEEAQNMARRMLSIDLNEDDRNSQWYLNEVDRLQSLTTVHPGAPNWRNHIDTAKINYLSQKDRLSRKIGKLIKEIRRHQAYYEAHFIIEKEYIEQKQAEQEITERLEREKEELLAEAKRRKRQAKRRKAFRHISQQSALTSINHRQNMDAFSEVD